MNKITVRADENVLNGFPRQWPARVRVRTSQTECERLVEHVPGDPQRPFNAAQVREKFNRLAGGRIDRVAAGEVVAACASIMEGRESPAPLLSAIERACG
jgi:2-methylcitrate dehydratase PrpD